MDLDTLLRDSASVADPTPHDLATGRSALDAATMISARRVAWVRRAKRRGLGLSAILAAAASLVLIIGPMLNTGPRPKAARPAASPTVAPTKTQAPANPTVDRGRGTPPLTLNVSLVLYQAGAAAGAQPGGWPDATYWHSVASYQQGSGPAHRREIWLGRTADGVLNDPGVSNGVIPLGPTLFGPGLTWDELYALPTESRALERKLRAGINGAGNGDDAEMFVIVGDLLRESPAPPALRKALWEIAARVPGVTLVGAVKDSVGRAGVDIRRGDQGYILDPKDGRLLEEYQGITGPDMPAGTSGRGTYLEQGPVDSAPPATSPTR